MKPSAETPDAPSGRASAARLVLCAVLTVTLAGLAACRGGAPGTAEEGRRSIVLVTVDTLRADHVALARDHGAGRIAELADRGSSTLDAVAPFGRTTQSVGTILTGMHPLRHGADGLGMPLPEKVTTLAEVLSGAGYDTAAFVSNLFLRPGLGFEQGFDTYSCPRPRWVGNSAPSITAEALAWLRARPDDGRPFFLWVHYLDPHWPYEPPAELASRVDPDWDDRGERAARDKILEASEGERIFFADEHLGQELIEHLKRMYLAEVLATDRAVGDLVDGLEAAGLLERSVVALTADHGESLGEHRYWFAHGEYLYDVSLEVPLVFVAPDLIPPDLRIDRQATLADLMPTLLDLVGVGGAGDVDGRSLVSELRGRSAGSDELRETVHLSDHHLVREENPRREVSGRDGRWWALRRGGMKLIRIPTSEGRELELYDLRSDPYETRNLAAERSGLAREMEQALLSHQQRLAAAAEPEGDGTAELSSEQQEMLRSLGYVR
jgi:arylsulfatase A-like enzyme